MRFAWKVFFPCLTVLVIAFSVFGYILTTNAFDTALSQEKQRALDKLTMLSKVVASYTADFGYYTDTAALVGVMESVATGDLAAARLYDKDGRAIYPIDAEETDFIMNASQGVVHEITKTQTGYTMRCCTPIQLGARVGYLYFEQDVSAPFALYASMTRTATLITVLAICAAGVLLLLLSAWLTRPVRKLSAATRKMADGNYRERCAVTTGDEIGELTADFNKMADALEAHMEQLEGEARKRENFVTSFAHELKTPLTSIIGYADMLRSQQLDEETRFCSANYIFTEGRRLERLSLKLLELMVLNRQQFDLVPTEIADIAARLSQAVASAVMEKYGVTLELSMPEATVLTEPDLFLTLLLNLIDNAGKAEENGQRVYVCGRCCPAGYRISVSDEGRGIPKEELERITEAFYMVDKSRARAQNGVGLGLALCDAIAKIHHTRLEFQSEPGKGTVVSLFIPYYMEADNV